MFRLYCLFIICIIVSHHKLEEIVNRANKSRANYFREVVLKKNKMQRKAKAVSNFKIPSYNTLFGCNFFRWYSINYKGSNQHKTQYKYNLVW